MAASAPAVDSSSASAKVSAPVLTVTLNACVDKTYFVPGFAVGHVHRPVRMVVNAGGKGINVARVYRMLGGAALATGFLGGANGDFLDRATRAEGIPTDFVRVAGESRVCIKVMDPDGGTETELNENGPEVSPADGEALIARLRELLPGHKAVILSGSMPPGTPVTLYRDIIRMAQDEFSVRAILDSSGAALAVGAEAAPSLLKPNVHEVSALGVIGDGWGGSAVDLRAKYGAALAMITGGPRGAVVAGEAGVWEALPPPISLVSAVGSGDTLTAAFVWGLLQDWSVADALRLGVAAGAANATTEASGFCDRDLIFALAEQTRVNRLV